MNRILQWVRGHREFSLFLAVGAFLGIYTGLFDSTFNNYLNDTFHIGEVVRGGLEFPRELPGMLVALISGLLFFIPDTRMGALSLVATSLGLLGLAFLAPTFAVMAIWMFLNSLGSHLYMPVSTSVGVALAEEGAVGKRLGQLQGVNTAATVLGSLFVLVAFSRLHIGYNTVYAVAAVMVALGAILLFKITPHPRRASGSRFVIKRKYTLFYILNVLFGARKQVFLTFGPWVLIKVFKQTPATFAGLYMAGSIIGIFVKPLIGRAIDRWGERALITFESFTLIFVCLGYGFARQIMGGAALYLVFTCYTLDQLLFAINMARATYLHKITDSPDDLTPTLSLGISLDHVVSMVIPVLGGLLWTLAGFEYVFVAAAVIAVLNLVAARWIGRESFRKGSDLSCAVPMD